MSQIADKALKQKLIFFAYQGRSSGYADDNVESIRAAIKNYNHYQKTYLAKSWEEYRKTTVISKEVLGAIDLCDSFVCDLTYLNHNVLFELGYAIAKNKRILVLLNKKIILTPELGSAANAYANFILKDIQYVPITNANCIRTALQDGVFEERLLNKLVNLKNVVLKSSDIFYIVSKVTNQASLDLSAAILALKDEKQLALVSDDTTEVKYQPLTWYFQNLLKAKAVVIHFLGEKIENSFIENAKNSFYAGIACGLDCKVLLVAPARFRSPLDYNDILVPYETSDQLLSQAIDWLDSRFKEVVVEKPIEKTEHERNLLKLGVGCDVAEYEGPELLNYFIYTSSYQAAFNYQKSIIVGRKGSGKTAIYIKLFSELSAKPQNYVVRLQPESEELLDDVNMAQLYDTSQKTFFVAVWKLVIYSKLIYSIREKLKSKPMHQDFSDFENAVVEFADKYQDFIKLNFFGVVRGISRRLRKTTKVDSPDIMETLFSEYLSPLTRILRDYFASMKECFFKLIILADNLDKTWDAKNDLSVQAEMVLTLLEMENKIKKDLIKDSDSKIEIKHVIFLRDDIFDYVKKVAIEPDKLTTMVHMIDWENYPNQLQELIENRFVHILGLKDRSEVSKKAWGEFFNFSGRKNPYDLILEVIAKRPRDLLYFVARLFESAVDSGHSKVVDVDLKYAIISYTKFLNENLIAETRAEFPEIAEILARLQSYHGQKIEYAKFTKILAGFGYDSHRQRALIEILFEKEYMLGCDEKTDEPFSEIELLYQKVNERKFIFFKNKVYLIAHAKYYLIKKKAFSPF